MSTAAIDPCDRCCLALYPPAPRIESLDQKVSGNWVDVDLFKTDNPGKRIPATMEISTGDLYGVKFFDKTTHKYKVDTQHEVAIKCAAMVIGTPFYMMGMMFCNIIKIALDVNACVRHLFEQIKQDYENKGAVKTFGNALITCVRKLSHTLMLDLWQIVVSPVYALWMMCASVYGIFKPYEGRKWISRIEQAWHGGESYRSDFRYGTQDLKSIGQFISLVLEGRFHMFGYCMQKRANIHDTINGVAKYRFFEKKEKPTSINQSSSLYDFSVTYNGRKQLVAVKKVDGKAIPIYFNFVASYFPTDSCWEQFVNDVIRILGTDQFTCGPIRQILSVAGDRKPKKTTIKQEGVRTIFEVEYNKKKQRVVIEKVDGKEVVIEKNIRKDDFSVPLARIKFLDDLLQHCNPETLKQLTND